MKRIGRKSAGPSSHAVGAVCLRGECDSYRDRGARLDDVACALGLHEAVEVRS